MTHWPISISGRQLTRNGAIRAYVQKTSDHWRLQQGFGAMASHILRLTWVTSFRVPLAEKEMITFIHHWLATIIKTLRQQENTAQLRTENSWSLAASTRIMGPRLPAFYVRLPTEFHWQERKYITSKLFIVAQFCKTKPYLYRQKQARRHERIVNASIQF